jgi:Tol biopolymer transport system component
MAALLLSALVGGSLARLRDSGETVAAAGGPVSAVMPEPVPVPTPGSVSEPAPVASTAPPAATPTPSPAPATSDPAPAAEAAEAAARPARLVDRREVDADAVFSPSFASTGTAVFFHAESGGVSALKRADGAAGELRVASIVDDGARNYHVRVSPDGREVAFDSDRDGIRGVYVARADGRGVHRVSGPGYAAVPTWSPDGRRLAFIRGEADRPAVWNLWLLDRATGEQARVTSFRRGQVWGGAWFADGRRLAYSHEDRLILQDLDTGRVREIASPLKGRLVRTPAVSPDGRWIVFQVSRDGVWLLDVERGSMQRVLDDASAEEFAWSPDGRRVAYHSRRSGGWSLWTMAVP